MTIEDFAKKAGVVIVSCEPHWGGKFGWKSSIDSNVTNCGFKTEQAAYKNWFYDKFGKECANLVVKLMKNKK